MDVLLSLVYVLFTICVVCPPSELVSAGITIPAIFDNVLGSESSNFIGYHMKRITLTCLIHSSLPLGYVFSLWVSGWMSPWLLFCAAATAILPLVVSFLALCWWEGDRRKHPVVKTLQPYVTTGSDWRVVAANLNVEFRSVDKVSVPLSTTVKFVATESWLIKVSQYKLNIIKQSDCSLVATSTDSHDISLHGEDEVQYVNIEVIPVRSELEGFSFRVTTAALRELQPRLARAVRVPDHISLTPTLVERFVSVFKLHVDQNPVYYIDQEPELCIGCMVAPADVKLTRRCLSPPPHAGDGPLECEQCNCRVLWCCACIARWWAARAGSTPAAHWLSARASCPVCRARFCLLDVCPARLRPS